MKEVIQILMGATWKSLELLNIRLLAGKQLTNDFAGISYPVKLLLQQLQQREMLVITTYSPSFCPWCVAASSQCKSQS
jgi:hypothetical protein